MAILYDNYWPSSSNIRLQVDDYYSKMGQSFTTSETYNTATVQVSLQRSGILTTATLGIYAVDGNGFPTGSALAENTVDVSTVTTSSGGTTVTFTLVASLTNGIKYALVIVATGSDADSILYWRGYSPSGLANGTGLEKTPDGWMLISSSDVRFRVYGDEPLPSKPINPTPANEATEVDFSGFTLSWEDGGGATSYDVYIGPSGSLVKVSSSQAGTSYVTNIDEVPYNQVIYWRVDAVNSVGTTTGDTWHFDARPGAAITPYPGNATSGITLDDTTASWESGSDNTINYDIYFRPFGEFYELVDSDITDLFCTLYETNYHYGWLYFWSVVAKNKFGTYPESAPDGFLSDYEWYFNAMVFSPVLPTGVTMVDGKPASGTTGTPTGENNMMTTKRLVAAAQNKIWYEAI